MLRFFCKREQNLIYNVDFELIVICQDKIDKEKIVFPTPFLLHCLNSTKYNKAKMCNTGVLLSKGDKIIILDNDRINRKNYFYDFVSHINEGEIFCPLHHYKLTKDFDDFSIESNLFINNSKYETRSNGYNPHCKTAFSGNTIMFKKDYLSSGLMDESYEGHGFYDNDFTMTCLKKGFKICLANEKELHLFHDSNFYFDNKQMETNDKLCFIYYNALRFFNKWNLPIDAETNELFNRINNYKQFKQRFNL